MWIMTPAAPVGNGTHPAHERFTRAVRPGRRQQDLGVVAVVGLVEFVEQSEIGVGERLLIEEHQRPDRVAQLGRQRRDKFLAAHDQLALVAHAR